MIALCPCGAIKTVPPYRSATEVPWLCSICSPAKKSRAASQAAQQAAGGAPYPLKAEPPKN